MNPALKRVLTFALAFSFLAGVLALGAFLLAEKPVESSNERTLRVLSYSSFINTWGPGPDLAKLFLEKEGVRIQFQDSSDAGLLLQKLELFPADVVIGFDQLLLNEARRKRNWRKLETNNITEQPRFQEPDFAAFDWGALTFVYRKGEIDPPKSLSDLSSPRFAGQIALQDPRTSSPGLQFLFWVLDEIGIEAGFEFLSGVKPNVHSVSASWSSAYGVFTQNLAKSAFSYMTSPIYHLVEEKNPNFAAAVFEQGHPAQIEYAGIPESCENCADADKFIRFLISPEAQRVIMQKNFMMPVLDRVREGTPFAELPEFKVRQWKNLPLLMESREELLARWSRLGL